ncbi:orotidine-5'-phosphate decarboxylase [Tessaracoccus flavus]|uniref:Orotidine-5'-phosphate decarboxylase n=1 Tax=Tessaracoccus flavus TaxID=1610493 RepID=A0A1Q2CE99_9ACTN|nr:orotidine-5'-phosphate decarboxylase [Tessaracoccus flavus]AQP44449.1 orotidine-5'-phosphate decarboxylase [Tessaracoccus flavus]SDY69681.1 orotidine-5'-phosphate decarboxylase [Tessaracoccus flavus]
MSTYAERLNAVTSKRGRLCVGIDPMPSVVEAWGLPNSVAGLEACARGIVEELGGLVAVFKPQSAFFEAFGSRGVAVLERVLADIRQAGALSILDVKRGDIGSSMAGYASAFLGDDAPLRADAITVSPYLGVGALRPAIDAAVAGGQGLYVLARTSNPEGAPIQLATSGSATVAQHVVDEAARINLRADRAVGLVVGGTHSDVGCSLESFNASILVPGIGAQGGSIAGLADVFGPALAHVLPTASRDVIGAGAAELSSRAHRLLDEARVLG